MVARTQSVPGQQHAALVTRRRPQLNGLGGRGRGWGWWVEQAVQAYEKTQGPGLADSSYGPARYYAQRAEDTKEL